MSFGGSADPEDGGKYLSKIVLFSDFSRTDILSSKIVFWNFRSLLVTSSSLSFVLTVLISLRANSRSTPSLDVAIGGKFLSILFLTLPVPKPEGLPLLDPATVLSPVLGTPLVSVQPGTLCGAAIGAGPGVETSKAKPGTVPGAEPESWLGTGPGAWLGDVPGAVPEGVPGAVPGAELDIDCIAVDNLLLNGAAVGLSVCAGLGCVWPAVVLLAAPDGGAVHDGELLLVGVVEFRLDRGNTNCVTAGTVDGADLRCSEDKHWWERLVMHFL